MHHPLAQRYRCCRFATFALVLAVLLSGLDAKAHDLPGDIEVSFRCRVGRVAGTLRIPESEGAVPCVVIAGGSLSHTRDGGFLRPGALPRDALERLAVALDKGGYASLRFDRMGYEVPFAGDATILIFKGDRLTEAEQEFVDYLESLAGRLEKDREDGIPFHLGALPSDHPARVFARKVSPDFEATLR